MKKLFAAKALLTQNSSPLDSLSLFNAMHLAGLLEEKEYVSSTGSGEIKRYHSLTEDGLKFGMNKSSPYSEKTELVFYPATFKALLVLASEEILTHSESL
ncbi:hypothetical protein OVA10_11205 [Lelliottia sp. SL45]|uniref:hypothetical protein n=1 Tax=Lelliottia sp. SL45 TaxID=2994665 RepID=UPI0022752F23|nr:hypothetical protein [Lelliottia sp. SL45]MCY1698613.1 hypothetical protein [Lelliottia sp. SL45]